MADFRHSGAPPTADDEAPSTPALVLTEASATVLTEASTPVLIEDLQLKDAEEARRLLYRRVFAEDVWRLAALNLTHARAFCVAFLCMGLVYYLTGSLVYNVLFSFGVLPMSYLLFVRYWLLHSYLSASCKDVCGDGATLYDFWSDNDNGRKLVVAKVGGSVAGTAAVSRLSDTSAEIQRVVVDERYAGKGIARILMNHIVDYCRVAGFRDIIIQVTSTNIRALKIYRKYGFRDHEEIRHGGLLRWMAFRLRLPLVDQ